MFLPGSVYDKFDTHISNLIVRVEALEGNDHAALVSRVGALETWRGAKASAIGDLSYTVSSDAVTILGISVPTAAAFSGHTSALNDLKSKVNTILSALRGREIITT